jgi:hypothetical protein
VFAVERSADDAENIRRNAADANVAIDVVVGDAPQALASLPDPDRVFVGGGGPAVVEACWQRLRPGGTLVATFAVMEHAVAARALLGEMVQLRIDRAVPIGDLGVRLAPLNPVFVCWGSRPMPASSTPSALVADAGPSDAAQLVVGIGMSSQATAAEVAELLDLTLLFLGAQRLDVVAIATRSSFVDDPRLPAGIPVEPVDDADLVAASDAPERDVGIPAQVAATAAELVARRRWGGAAMLVPTQRSAHATVAVCGKDHP